VVVGFNEAQKTASSEKSAFSNSKGGLDILYYYFITPSYIRQKQTPWRG
jgi:hypothetical protein